MNKNTLINFALFTTGAAIGSVVTWKLLKTKYEQIAQEEIESVKETFQRLREDEEDELVGDIDIPTEPDHRTAEKPPLAEYAARVRDLEYGDGEHEEKEDEPVDKPYVIEPGEFDELGYETVTLYLYEDGTITDEQDNIIDDIEGMTGAELIKHFGEYEDDSVFVRSDARQCDYEILRCQGKFPE